MENTMASEEKTYHVYGYRWVVLAVFMFVNLAIQVLWIAYAPITKEAASFYNVSIFQIGLLAMTFMITFIPLSIPVSWVIDTYGFRLAVGMGVVLMGVFGVLRGLAGTSYSLVLVSTIGLAIAQPFLMNAWTKVPALWFDQKERATAVGLVTLSSLIGVAVGMVLTPILIEQYPINSIQLIYGLVAVFSAVLFLIFAREKPATPPCPEGMEVRALMLDGLKHALTVRDFWFYLFVYFIGMGIFNGIDTWVENIIAPRGFNANDAGILGAVMMVGGLLGAVVIPPFSDRLRKRKRFILWGIILSIPGLLGVTFAANYWMLMTSAFFLGFFLISTGPVGMQYVAEITQPTPEGTSNGLIQLFGQASVVFVYVMQAMQDPNGAFTPGLLFSAGLMVVLVVLIMQLKDPVLKTPKAQAKDEALEY